MENHDEINKKFDEMEEILMELQKKEEEKSYITETPKNDSSKKRESFDKSFENKDDSKLEQKNEDGLKMPVFTFGGLGGLGVNSFSNLNSAKNVKSPIFLKSKLT